MARETKARRTLLDVILGRRAKPAPLPPARRPRVEVDVADRLHLSFDEANWANLHHLVHTGGFQDVASAIRYAISFTRRVVRRAAEGYDEVILLNRETGEEIILESERRLRASARVSGGDVELAGAEERGAPVKTSQDLWALLKPQLAAMGFDADHDFTPRFDMKGGWLGVSALPFPCDDGDIPNVYTRQRGDGTIEMTDHGETSVRTDAGWAEDSLESSVDRAQGVCSEYGFDFVDCEIRGVCSQADKLAGDVLQLAQCCVRVNRVSDYEED